MAPAGCAVRVTSTLSFVIGTIASGAISLTPSVDGVSLIELVRRFETTAGFEPAGGYGGLIPDYFKYPPFDEYFLGKSWTPDGPIWLLGCDCGEVGCWPLEASIDADARTVTWKGFRQPYRSGWDYSGFGPFVFERAAYEAALNDLRRLI
jgi:hypothetical protein